MKQKIHYFLLLATLLTAGLLWLNFAPEEPGEAEKNALAPALTPSPALVPAPARPVPSAEALAREEKRLATLRAEYAELEQARAALRQQLGRLKARLWKTRLPAAQAPGLDQADARRARLVEESPLVRRFSECGGDAAGDRQGEQRGGQVAGSGGRRPASLRRGRQSGSCSHQDIGGLVVIHYARGRDLIGARSLGAGGGQGRPQIVWRVAKAHGYAVDLARGAFH